LELLVAKGGDVYEDNGDVPVRPTEALWTRPGLNGYLGEDPAAIETGGREVESVFTNQPAVLHVEDDIDISRGDFLVKTNDLPKVENEIKAIVCWLDKKELNEGNKYFIQHKSKVLKAIIKEIEYKIDVNTLEKIPVTENIKLNEVVKLRLKTASPLVFDSFEDSRDTGNAILIDETSNSTVGAVMIL
jgi:sulfate adenylyltransferase subunit 1